MGNDEPSAVKLKMKEHFTFHKSSFVFTAPPSAPALCYLSFVLATVTVTSVVALLIFLIRRTDKFVAIMPQYLRRQDEC